MTLACDFFSLTFTGSSFWDDVSHSGDYTGSVVGCGPMQDPPSFSPNFFRIPLLFFSSSSRLIGTLAACLKIYNQLRAIAKAAVATPWIWSEPKLSHLFSLFILSNTARIRRHSYMPRCQKDSKVSSCSAFAAHPRTAPRSPRYAACCIA